MAIHHGYPTPQYGGIVANLTNEGEWGTTDTTKEDRMERRRETPRVRDIKKNRFVKVITDTCDGGADIRIYACGSYVIDSDIEVGTGAVRMRLRHDTGPRVGQRVMVDGRLVKVKDRRWSDDGRLMLLDEDTRAWVPWGRR